MPNFAQITLVGHIGRDAETRFTGSGKPITSFSLAVGTGYGERKQTSWYNVSLWNKEQLTQYLTKGKAVLVVGEPSVREYEKKDGGKGYSFDVSANSITFVGGKDDAESAPKPATKRVPEGRVPDGAGAITDDDVPFMRYDVPCL